MCSREDQEEMFETIVKEEICPVCLSPAFKISIRRYSRDKNIYEVLSSCDVCGFHSFNVFIMGDDIRNKPRRKRVKIEKHSDMDIKIVRSNTASIRIKELGVEIDPGSAAQGEIMTVDTLLRKISNIVRAFTNEENRKRSEEILTRIKDIREKERFDPIHIVLEDPYGDSTFLDADFEEEDFTDEELKELKIEIIENMGKIKERQKRQLKLHQKRKRRK